MPKISIIMPVYNGSAWLDESITSVIEQTFDDFELICVNDSSTDNSEDILKNYSNKDSRIKYFTKPNEGPGIALNYGVQKAQGEYLCFLDQDDKYSPLYLEKMLNSIAGKDFNMSLCNAYFWEADNSLKVIYKKYINEEINIKTLKDKKHFLGEYYPQWTKIVKRKFWLENNIEFPDRNNKAHDVPVHCQLICLCDKIGYVKDCLYCHRHYPEQISYSFDVPFYHFETVKNLFDWMEKNSKTRCERAKMKKITKYLLIVTIKISGNIQLLHCVKSFIKEKYSAVDYFFLNRRLKKKMKKIRPLILTQINCKNVGKNSYCASQPFIVNRNRTIIGSFVSIGENVRIGHGEHPLHFLSTSPYFYFDNLGWKTSKTPSHNEYWNYKPVEIGNDVWIGDNVLIKNGIKIGDGAVIGMGAVVTKDVPPYAVVAGVPAKVIKYRFDEETIAKLLETKWWELDNEQLKQLPYDSVPNSIDYLIKIRRS